MPWLSLLAVAGSLIGLFRGVYNMGASWSMDFTRGPDGVLVESTSRGGSGRTLNDTQLPPVVIAHLTTTVLAATRQVWFQFGEGWWVRTEWTLEVEPEPGFSPLTAADRVRIAEVLFPLCGEKVPPRAEVSAVPVPGETSVVGHVTHVHYGLLAVWLLTGVPGLVLIAWFLVGFAWWVTRNSGHKWMLCGGCGYNRTGLTKETPCPECGAGGMHAVCPECGKAP